MPASPHILVPVDFSPASATAAELAARIAQRVGVGLRLVHVCSPSGAAILSVEPVIVPPALWDELVGENRTAADEKLGAVAAGLGKVVEGVEIDTEILVGAPTNEILEAATAAEMVVMGSHGSTGAERMFFGSVAEVVSRTASCPVLVTRAASGPVTSQFDRVVVGVDLGANSKEVALLAKQFVAAGGVLEIVHVQPGPFFSAVEVALSGSARELQDVAEQARTGAVEALDDLTSSITDELVLIESTVERGRVEDVLLAHGEGAGLVVVGAHSRDQISERVLGTTADRVLRHSPTPVLLLPLQG